MLELQRLPESQQAAAISLAWVSQYSEPVKFHSAGYAFIALVVLVVAGFWRSYFSTLGTAPTWFHIHGVLMMTWLALLVIQPFLVKKQRLEWHRRLGRISYLVFPLLVVSVLVMLHRGLKRFPDNGFTDIISVIRDVVVLVTAYSIAIIYRKDFAIHARAMTMTGVACIEPALGRLVGTNIVALVVLSLIGLLVIFDRRGRWMFGALLVVYAADYFLVLRDIPLTPLDPIVHWFASL
jgi:hypothetical protein